MLSALYADCAIDPNLRTVYLETIIESARRAVGRTLEHATARGDLRDDADRELLLDMVGSLVHYQAMFKPHHLTDLQAGRAIELLFRGAAKDYPGLVAHSEALEQEHAHD